MALVDLSYDIAKRLPDEERFALATQIRKAAVSIPANIAEGYGRGTRAEYARFVGYANGSLKELETEFMVAGRQKYVTPAELRAPLKKADEVGRMLAALRRRLRRPPKP